jgi:dTMP kinase
MKAIVFDLDGTLTDSASGIIRAVRYAIDKMQVEMPSDELISKFLGPPLALSFREYMGFNHEEAVKATEYYREVYNTEYWKDNKVYPGIRQLLISLKRNGHRLYVVTGKPMAIANKVITHFKLDHFFDRVIGPDENQYYDGKCASLNAALNGNKNAIMVGDRASDILGAREYGIPVVYTLYGYGSIEEYNKFDADFIVDNVEELYDVLKCPKAKYKGYFISIEGNDGSGKSTQRDLLRDKLVNFGFDVYATREPGGTPLSEKIRGLLLDRENNSMTSLTEAYLFASARAQHVEEVIMPAINRGELVLSDRFVDSSVAYQGAGHELGMDIVAKLNAPAVNGAMPDTTVYLDLPFENAMRRRQENSKADRIELYDYSFHERAQEAFHKLVKDNPERFISVDAAGDAETISKDIFACVIERLIDKEKVLCG